MKIRSAGGIYHVLTVWATEFLSAFCLIQWLRLNDQQSLKLTQSIEKHFTKLTTLVYLEKQILLIQSNFFQAKFQALAVWTSRKLFI